MSQKESSEQDVTIDQEIPNELHSIAKEGEDSSVDKNSLVSDNEMESFNSGESLGAEGIAAGNKSIEPKKSVFRSVLKAFNFPKFSKSGPKSPTRDSKLETSPKKERLKSIFSSLDVLGISNTNRMIKDKTVILEEPCEDSEGNTESTSLSADSRSVSSVEAGDDDSTKAKRPEI